MNLGTMELTNNDAIKVRNEDIDEILRGEISALEAYEQVISEITDASEINRLKKHMADHEDAIRFWKHQAKVNGTIPNIDSGIWGNVVEAFVGVSKLAGEDTALMALKKGEEHGLELYEKLLLSDKLSVNQKRKIREQFAPIQRDHIKVIDHLLSG